MHAVDVIRKKRDGEAMTAELSGVAEAMALVEEAVMIGDEAPRPRSILLETLDHASHDH